MKFFLCTFLFTFLGMLSTALHAQEPQTIRIRKESNLVKAVFDGTDPRLFVVDRFGNPKENRILSYKLYVKGRKETQEFSGFNNRLTGEMIQCLNRQKETAKLFFTEISVEDDNGHIVKLPDVIDTWFPNCKNCERDRRQR